MSTRSQLKNFSTPQKNYILSVEEFERFKNKVENEKEKIDRENNTFEKIEEKITQIEEKNNYYDAWEERDLAEKQLIEWLFKELEEKGEMTDEVKELKDSKNIKVQQKLVDIAMNYGGD